MEDITVTKYMIVGLVGGIGYSIYYINKLFKRMRNMETIFIQSMAAISEDMIAVEDKMNKINENVDTISTFLDEKYNPNK